MPAAMTRRVGCIFSVLRISVNRNQPSLTVLQPPRQERPLRRGGAAPSLDRIVHLLVPEWFTSTIKCLPSCKSTFAKAARPTCYRHLWGTGTRDAEDDCGQHE